MWELWSVNIALAMSTWSDVAVTYWNQVYHQSEESRQGWRRSSMTEGLRMRSAACLAARLQFQLLVMPLRHFFDMTF